MKTEELINGAMGDVNSAQNETWFATEENPLGSQLAKMLFLDAQTRALIAIAQELKRMNDKNTVHWTGPR